MSDYVNLFKDIIAPHLHKLVELVKGSNYRRVLIHEWVLGIEYNWVGYAHKEDDDTSEFVPRLSFWIGGLRDKFNSNPSKKQVIDLLHQTFDASTYCYFDYGARSDIERQINNYCTQVDDWFGEKILTPKLDRFRLSKKAIPFINTNLDILQRYNSELGSSKLEISKEIQNASDLEKEFNSMFRLLMDEYIKVMRRDTDSFIELNKYFDSFLDDCKKLGYNISVSKKQKSDLENIKQKIDLKNLIQDTKDILKGTFDIETNKINKIINSDSQFVTICQDISIEVSSQIIEQVTSSPP